MKNTYISLTANLSHYAIVISAFLFIVNLWAILTNQIADDTYWYYALVIGSPFALFLLFSRFVIIRRRGEQFTFRDIMKMETLIDVSDMEMWWNYEMKAPSGGKFDLSTGKAVDKKVYLYARLRSGDKSVIIYELIHFSKDFIEGLEFKEFEEEDGVACFKVWSLKRCLGRLGVEGDMILDA